MRTRKTLLASAALATAMAIPAAALGASTGASPTQAETPPTIRVVNGFRVIAGGYDTQRTLGTAVERFGPPSTRRRRFESCDVRWKDLAARWGFYNLGGQNPCSNEGGYVGTASLAGEWRTARGLRVGDPASRIRRVEPTAFRCDPQYLIAPDARARSVRFRLSARELATVKRRCRARSGGRSGYWWLAPGYSIAGGTYYSRVMARVVRGRVASFQLTIGAGGD